MITVAVSPDEVKAMDWNEEYQPKPHPVRVMISEDLKQLIDMETREVICTCSEKYAWYWNHSHAHVRKVYENPVLNEPGEQKLDMLTNLDQARTLISRAIYQWKSQLPSIAEALKGENHGTQ